MNKFIESLKYTYLYDLIFPIVQIFQTLNWNLKNKHTSTPHLIKQRVVKDYQEKYKVKTLVETGTYLGAMANATKNDFSKIYTIELDKKLYGRAKNKFKKFKHINVLLGDSAKILPIIIKTIKKPILFWLDAHFSKGITARSDKETPIIEELNCILNHPIKKHVILIDDANGFKGKGDYPTLGYVRSLVKNKQPSMRVQIRYNIIRITPKY